MASWGRCLEVLEQHDSRVILELKALREGAWKLSKFTAFAPKLVVKVSRELRALLKVSNRAHPELQALLIDFLQYRPKLLVSDTTEAPPELGMSDPARDPDP